MSTVDPEDAGRDGVARDSAAARAADPHDADPRATEAAAAHAPAAGDDRGPAAVAGRTGGVQQILGEDFSVAQAVGGVRGLAEAVAPGLVFVVVFIATGALIPPLVASLAVAVAAMVVRLVQRTPVTQAAGGLVGVVIGVVWAWRSGEAQDYFAWGLWTNAAYAVALVLALLLRWPVVGVVVSLLRGQDFSWRTDPAQRARRSRYVLATWLWVVMFLLRLVVQVPLYLQAEVAWLGTARLVMGLPLWALTLWATWVLVRERGAAAAR
ncbi:DUF3159 domain-containing protein [Georgenia sp. AZ-5]|uniref:DUF3159 domain-containing protein n=1 Tax=Georgenia sp. AZ-5 TaxID=3367526 RepID=UPI0037553B94